MEALVHQGQNGVAMTQRSAFERVFGSRYVKSTVCRHRGVWRKAEGSALRTQFEAMGTDERACWGEFVRRMEGRGNVNVTGANEGAGTSTSSASTSQKSTGMYQTRTAQRRGEGDKAPAGPAMASLQNPSDKGNLSSFAFDCSEGLFRIAKSNWDESEWSRIKVKAKSLCLRPRPRLSHSPSPSQVRRN